MLEALARNWRWLLFRALLAASYGIAVFVWPDSAFIAFVYLFSLYAIFDGTAALAIAMDVKDFRGFGSLFFEALVRIAGGLVALGEPVIFVNFPRFLAAWAILAGVADVVVAIVLRRELVGEWPLPVAGVISIITALALIAIPVTVGVGTLRWLIGPYVMMVGVALVGLALRLRQLEEEIKSV
jgi:uncharacterized membrane protein HdeD (DUF308 family)